jgi:hypothetical protein
MQRKVAGRLIVPVVMFAPVANRANFTKNSHVGGSTRCYPPAKNQRVGGRRFSCVKYFPLAAATREMDYSCNA